MAFVGSGERVKGSGEAVWAAAGLCASCVRLVKDTLKIRLWEASVDVHVNIGFALMKRSAILSGGMWISSTGIWNARGIVIERKARVAVEK